MIRIRRREAPGDVILGVFSANTELKRSVLNWMSISLTLCMTQTKQQKEYNLYVHTQNN